MTTRFLLASFFLVGVAGVHSPGAATTDSQSRDEAGVVRRHTTSSYVVSSSGKVDKLGVDKDFPEALLQAIVDRPRDASSLLTAKTFVERLAKRVAVDKYKTTDTEAEMLSAIRQYMQEFEDDLFTARDENQEELNSFKTSVDNCISEAATARGGDPQTLKETCDTRATTHGDCRELEETDQTSMSTACELYHEYRKSISSDDCITSSMSAEQIASDDQDVKESMEQCLVSSMVWLEPLYQHYLDCKHTTGNHTEKKAECDQEQTLYETCLCTYASDMKTICTSETSCHVDSSALYNEAETRIRVIEDSSKSNFAAVKKIVCYCDVIEAETEDKQQKLDDCQALAIDDTNLTITYPVLPDLETCPTVATPCDADWTGYSEQGWYEYVSSSFYGSDGSDQMQTKVDCSTCGL